MCKKSAAHRWGILYLSLCMALYICCGYYVQKWANETADLIMIDTTQANAVASDWDKFFYTDLIVTDWSECPADYPDNMLSRPFKGAMLGCDCLGVANKWMQDNNQVIQGQYCSINQTLAGCKTSMPVDPID